MTSFAQAFAKARKEKGAGKTFMWNGKSYSTNYKEEVSKAPSNSPRPKARENKPSVSSVAPTRGPAPTGSRLEVKRPSAEPYTSDSKTSKVAERVRKRKAQSQQGRKR
jgi:hypothetical protein